MFHNNRQILPYRAMLIAKASDEENYVKKKKHVKQVSWKVSGILFPVQELCLNYCVKIVQIQNYFWSVFSRICPAYSVRKWKNTDQK